MNFDPGHIILALTFLALTAPALRLTSASARGAFPFVAQPIPSAPVFLAVEPTRPSVQIARLDSIVSAAVDKARHAERLHQDAYQQVDAADYALQGLKNELAAISGLVAGAAVPVRSVPARGLPVTPRLLRPSALAA